MATLDDVIDSWRLSLRAANPAPRTIAQYVVVGKGRRERGCPFGGKTAVVIDRYLRVRKTHRLADAEWLWLARNGQLTSSGLGQMLDRRGPSRG